MKCPNTLYLSVFFRDNAIKWKDTNDRWHVGADLQRRPVGQQTFRQRLSATWLVFTGRADALVWPGEDDAERRGASANLPCGHHKSSLIRSVESETTFCEVCDLMSQRDDAVTMEETYYARITSLEATVAIMREALKRISSFDCYGQIRPGIYKYEGINPELKAYNRLGDMARAALAASKSAREADALVWPGEGNE